MIKQQETEDAFKAAQKGYQVAELIFNFIDCYRDLICEISPRPAFVMRDDTLKGLWMRSYCWISSLLKLNSPVDFQAVATANRALFEIYVDMIFLHKDKSTHLAEKLFWWHKSEKLKAAECKVKFQQKKKLTIDVECQGFISRESSEIRLNRKRIWGIENKHPKFKRWTEKDLSVDVQEADKSFSDETKKVLGKSLEEFYETKYRAIHWDIHSGISAFWNYNKEKYYYSSFFYFWDSASLSLLCTKIIMSDPLFTKSTLDFNQIYNELLINRSYILSQK